MSRSCTKCGEVSYGKTSYKGLGFLCDNCLIDSKMVKIDNCYECRKTHKRTPGFIGVSRCVDCRGARKRKRLESDTQPSEAVWRVDTRHPPSEIRHPDVDLRDSIRHSELEKDYDILKERYLLLRDEFYIPMGEDYSFLKCEHTELKEDYSMLKEKYERKITQKGKLRSKLCLERNISAKAIGLLEKFTKLPYVKDDPIYSEHVREFEEFLFFNK